MDGSTQATLLRYRILVDLTLILARTTRQHDLLDAVHLHMGQLFVAPITMLALRGPQGQWTCLTREADRLHHKTLTPQADGLLERVWAGRLRLTNDLATYVQQEDVTLRRLDQASALPPTASWMGVPLGHPGADVTGVLSVQSYRQAAFSPQDLELLEVFAAHLSVALDNAALRERLECEAMTDELTGLGNRRRLMLEGERAMAQGPLCVALLDIQDFKQVNDERGHLVGDAVLREVAELLRTCVQPSGEAFRLGGDEFALLLPGPVGDQEPRLRQLRAALAAMPADLAAEVNLGLAGSRPGEGLDDLLGRADERMYQAKARRVFVDPPRAPAPVPPEH
ncbi:diguanylate cyclase domain-containing protein [uncultured Deinococcus sp.]|uniref:GGDEF domain-containing protein n=1 Tax=uncultured Deinococcus sp. TaxID=158789 RepID=UPI003749A41C